MTALCSAHAPLSRRPVRTHARRYVAFSLALATLLATLPAFAQDSRPALGADVQAQMTPAEFKAAGLGKLSPAELASLNGWLQKTVVEETQKVAVQVRADNAKVVEQAREEGRASLKAETRGFFDFGSKEPIVATITGNFSGFGKGARFVLDNGQEWQQVDDTQVIGSARSGKRKVTIKPGVIGVWYMQLEGYNSSAKVQRTK